MKTLILCFAIILLLVANSYPQPTLQSFLEFREVNRNWEYQQLNNAYPRPGNLYYKGYSNTPRPDEVLFFNTTAKILALTKEEQQKLTDNHFFITERLSFNHFSEAFHHVYANDLPVFVSTDAILQALHGSYAFLLKTIERDLLSGNIEKLIASLYHDFPAFSLSYAGKIPEECLADLDLYLTVLYSLITDNKQAVRIASESFYNEVMECIKNEIMVELPLFCKLPQKKSIDFSQFKVRGHYVYTESDKRMRYKSLEPYFKAMMWIGRIDFYLTPPPNTPWTKPWDREENRRMNIDAFLLNQMLQQSEALHLYQLHETLIDYFVGISDNVSPAQYSQYLAQKNITSAAQLINDSIYDDYLLGLVTNKDFEQQILGEALFADPDAEKPDLLPISFKLSGQRYIIDSHILSNVVYDRIVRDKIKIRRMMPLTLDALFALGNNDAAFFLQPEIDQYHYAPNLANMRYLVDSKPESYWEASLYNTWLSAIRELNPKTTEATLPFFMQTSAWHHQKMNTQLGSWTQLRHDNLLYAKPSYTSMSGCSYPYSYIEPYPAFYERLAVFTAHAADFMSKLKVESWEFTMIPNFFTSFSETMIQLRDLAIKEIHQQPFSESEEKWLKQMLFIEGGSGAPPYSGWYSKLFLNPEEMVKNDFLTVDLHTQPTDEYGSVVGKVLHTGVGKVNLGVFTIPQPGNENQYITYTGPFFSYYEKITDHFQRLTDQDWQSLVEKKQLPDRPSWTATFLLDESGSASPIEKELPFMFLVSKGKSEAYAKEEAFRIFPTPTSGTLHIKAMQPAKIPFGYSIADFAGRIQESGTIFQQESSIDLAPLPKGIYLISFYLNGQRQTFKIIKNQ